MNRLDFLKSISASSRQKQIEATPSIKMMYGLSAALHVLLFLIVMFVQHSNPVPVVPFAVQVDLVSFSPGLPASTPSSDLSRPDQHLHHQKNQTVMLNLL